MVHKIKNEQLLEKNLSKYIFANYIFNVVPSEDLINKIYSEFINGVYDMKTLSNFIAKNNKYFSIIELIKYIDNNITLNDSDVKNLLLSSKTLNNILFLISKEDLNKKVNGEVQKDNLVNSNLQEGYFRNIKSFLLIQDFENLNPNCVKQFESLLPEYKELANIYNPNMTDKEKINFYYIFIRTDSNIEYFNLEQLNRIKENTNNTIINSSNNINNNPLLQILIDKTIDKNKMERISTNFTFNFNNRSLEQNVKLLSNHELLFDNIFEHFYNFNKTEEQTKDLIYFLENIYKYENYKLKSLFEFHLEHICRDYDIDISLKEKIIFDCLKEYNYYSFRLSMIVVMPTILKNEIVINNFIEYLNAYKKLLKENSANTSFSKTKEFLNILNICESLGVYDKYKDIFDEFKQATINIKKNKSGLSFPSNEEDYKKFQENIYKMNNDFYYVFGENGNHRVVLNAFEKKISKKDIYMLAVLKTTGKLYETNEYLFNFLQNLKLTDAQSVEFRPILINIFANLPTEIKVEIFNRNNLLKKNKIEKFYLNYINITIPEREIKLENQVKYLQEYYLNMPELSKEELIDIINNQLNINLLDAITVKNILELYKKYPDKAKYEKYIVQIINSTEKKVNYSKIIFDLQIDKILIIEFGKTTNTKWIEENVESVNYCFDLYKEDLISSYTFLNMLRQFNKNITLDERELIIKAINENYTENSFYTMLKYVKDFNANDIKNIKFLNFIIAMTNKKIISLCENGFSFNDLKDKSILNDFNSQYINMSDNFRINIMLKDLYNLLPNKQNIEFRKQEVDIYEKLVSTDIINIDNTFNILSKFLQIDNIFKKMDREIQNILDGILKEESYVKLIAFIQCINHNLEHDYKKYEYKIINNEHFNFEKYNTFIKIFDKNIDPKNHKVYLNDEDYSFLHYNLKHRFLQYSFLYKRVFNVKQVENINVLHYLKEVDLFAFFQKVKSCNLNFIDIETEDLRSFEDLMTIANIKDIIKFIQIYPSKNIEGLP